MATKILQLNTIIKLRNFSTCRTFTSGKVIFNKRPSTGSSKISPASRPPPSSASSPPGSGDVPGLSKKVVSYGSEPVGPGAAKNTNYKNPEYFSYNEMSYFEAEIEMLKYRCPQPSSLKS